MVCRFAGRPQDEPGAAWSTHVRVLPWLPDHAAGLKLIIGREKTLVLSVPQLHDLAARSLPDLANPVVIRLSSNIAKSRCAGVCFSPRVCSFAGNANGWARGCDLPPLLPRC